MADNRDSEVLEKWWATPIWVALAFLLSVATIALSPIIWLTRRKNGSVNPATLPIPEEVARYKAGVCHANRWPFLGVGGKALDE